MGWTHAAGTGRSALEDFTSYEPTSQRSPYTAPHHGLLDAIRPSLHRAPGVLRPRRLRFFRPRGREDRAPEGRVGIAQVLKLAGEDIVYIPVARVRAVFA